MADYKKIIPFIKKFEGGYANVAGDRGSCTNMGVTIYTFRKYYGANMTCSDLKKITEEQWLRIFYKGFWEKCKGDEIKSQSVANELVDFYWGSGVWAIKKIQKCLGIEEDGLVGNITLAKINDAEPEKLFNELKEERKNFFKNIVKAHPSQKKFLKGWLNRAEALKYSE
jgi:lysozyme family protein